MAKRSKAPTNLGQGIPRVGGELVDRLNKLDEGLGTALAYELNHRFSLADVRSRAAAGHAGTVVIAEQPRDSAGNKAAAIDVSGGNVAGSGWATQGDHLTPLSQVRSLFTCDHFGGHPSGFPGWFEECVQAERRAAATPFEPIPGLVHAMWGYTYEIPNFSDTFFSDPGLGEIGWGTYWEYIIPVSTTVDQVTWWLEDGGFTNGGQIHFGLYDLNQSAESFPLVCQTVPTGQIESFPFGANTIALTERVTIEPGRYALAYLANCFWYILSIRGNFIPWEMVNSLQPLPHFGIFNGDVESPLPDELNLGNVREDVPLDIETLVLPAVYFSDSQEFSG